MAVDKKTIIAIVVFLSALSILELSIFTQKTDKVIFKYETAMDFEVDVTVRNTGNAAAFNIPLRLGLPSDYPPWQYVTKINLSEEPDNRTVDDDGNKYVHYTIDRLEPGSEKKYTLNMSFRIVSIDFNIQKNRIGKLENDRNITRFLLETPHINVNDSGIQEVAHEIAKNSSNPLDIAMNTYDWVIKNINYEVGIGEDTAVDTLKNRKGDSGEFGTIFATLLRVNGIPAKRINGWGHRFTLGEVVYQQNVSHGFAEFYLPGYGWMQADPTFGRTHYFENFAMTDPDHIIMSEGIGHHFLERGPPESGERQINTEYKIIVKNIVIKYPENKNEIVGQDLVITLMFIMPALFAMVIIYKKLRQRHI